MKVTTLMPMPRPCIKPSSRRRFTTFGEPSGKTKFHKRLELSSNWKDWSEVIVRPFVTVGGWPLSGSAFTASGLAFFTDRLTSDSMLAGRQSTA